MNEFIPVEKIENKIYLIRGQKVMLDRDLAELYGVETRALKQAVKRNKKRFPIDFMFELTENEFRNWRSQFVMSNSDRMGLRWEPYAFTEQGIAMLSSVLRSERAIQVNIIIMRAFVRIRQLLSAHKGILAKLNELEEKTEKNVADIQLIFDAIRKMLAVEEKPCKRIGFKSATSPNVCLSSPHFPSPQFTPSVVEGSLIPQIAWAQFRGS